MDWITRPTDPELGEGAKLGSVEGMVNPSSTDASRTSGTNDVVRRVTGTPSICMNTHRHTNMTTRAKELRLAKNRNVLFIS
jgi:hypothetical protein